MDEQTNSMSRRVLDFVYVRSDIIIYLFLLLFNHNFLINLPLGLNFFILLTLLNTTIMLNLVIVVHFLLAANVFCDIVCIYLLIKSSDNKRKKH